MYETSYHRASSVDDAVSKLTGADDGKYLAGGHTLLPTMKQRLAAPSDLVDLSRIDGLKGISVKGRSVRIGAMTTHYEVHSNADLKKVCPALSEMAGWIGDPAVRHRGTIGGSIANNDPAADYPSAMLAMEADIITSKRTISAGDFFTGMFETALEEDEIVTAVEFTAPSKAAYEKFRNPASRYAMAGVFVAHSDNGARVGVTGASSGGVYRATDMEKALSDQWSADALDSCDQNEGMMLSDIHGTAAYRASLVKVMAKRAVAKAG